MVVIGGGLVSHERGTPVAALVPHAIALLPGDPLLRGRLSLALSYHGGPIFDPLLVQIIDAWTVA